MLEQERFFITIYSEHMPFLFSWLIKLTRDKEVTEDILQDVFMKFWLIKDSYDTIDCPKAFLLRSTQNALINYSSKQRVRQQTIQGFNRRNKGDFNTIEEIIYAKEVEVLLQKAIQELSPQKKRVYVLCKMEGLSFKEAASLLSISPLTVKEMMRLSTKQIRNYIKRWTGNSANAKGNQKQAVVVEVSDPG